MISPSKFLNALWAAGNIASLSLLIGLGLNASPAAYAKEATPKEAPLAQAASRSQVRQGLPGRRAAAATRDAGSSELIVLAPAETPWLSLSDEPSLLIYVGGDRQQGQLLEVLVGTDRDDSQQVYDKFFEVPAGGGFFKVTLTDPLTGRQLRPGESYLWQVSLIPDPENRSSDRYAYGELVQAQPNWLLPASAPNQISHPNPLVRAQALKSQGLWQAAALTLYDALQSRSLSTAERTQAEADWTALLEAIELGDLAQAQLHAELTETRVSQQR